MPMICVSPATAFEGDPKQNHLLAALPVQDYARLLPNLERISMPMGKTLFEHGDQKNYMYFPTTSIISLLCSLENGASGEIAIIGKEGLVGVSLFMGGGNSSHQALVRSPGVSYRLRADILKQEFALGGSFQRVALRFTQALITQLSQTAMCNRHHTLDQQLCRWLLLSLDRLPGNELVMTQELIAHMLGVRREGVTEAAGMLQKNGMITYKRGHITVLDRPKLEERVCECYSVVKKEYARLLPASQPASPL